MEVLYHIRPYFVGIFPYIGLIYGRYLQFRILKFPLIYGIDTNVRWPMAGYCGTSVISRRGGTGYRVTEKAPKRKVTSIMVR